MKYYDIKVDENKWDLDTKSTDEKSLQLFITNRCNLNCKNCFSQSLSKQQKLDMNLEFIKNIVKNNKNFNRVNLMGGEPLLHKQINEIIKSVKSIGEQRVAIFTNATLLNRLDVETEPVRLTVSFHELEHECPSRKAIVPKMKNLKKFYERGNDIKFIFLIDRYNYKKLDAVVNYFDKEVPWVQTLRIGLMRNEDDFWNDKASGVISFKKYQKIIQKLLNKYKGKLSFEILTKGVLIFNHKKQDSCSVDRFRNVYTDGTFSDCVMGVDSKYRRKVNDDFTFPPTHKVCRLTNSPHCLIYKVKLNNKQKH